MCRFFFKLRYSEVPEYISVSVVGGGGMNLLISFFLLRLHSSFLHMIMYVCR